jgi:hypothetical protein
MVQDLFESHQVFLFQFQDILNFAIMGLLHFVDYVSFRIYCFLMIRLRFCVLFFVCLGFFFFENYTTKMYSPHSIRRYMTLLYGVMVVLTIITWLK